MSKVEMMSAKDKKKGALVPRLRFPEFRDAGEWEINHLGQICENLDNRRVPITENMRVRGVIPYYGASGIVDYVDDFIFDEELLCISEDGANLIARTSPIAFSISGKSWVNNHAHVLKFDLQSRQKFVENYINFIKIEQFLTGMAQPKLNKAKLEVIPIPIPPAEEEQQRIADCLFSLDERITAETSKLDTLKDHKKGLLKQLFPAEGETLPRLRFPEFRDAGEWEGKKLKNICEKIMDGTHFSPKSKCGPFLYITSKNIQNGLLDLSNVSSISEEEHRQVFSKCPVKINDILLTKDGANTGNCALNSLDFEFSLLSSVAVLRGKKESIIQEFLYHTIASAFFQKIIKESISGQAITRITLEKIGNYHILFPNKFEQQRIADSLSSLDEIITAQTQKIDLLKTHKKGLMQQLFPVIDEAKA